MPPLRNNQSKQTGTSMIEVLVTLVILLVGLLGLAGLQVQAQRSEMESYQRVQALVLLQDIVGRMNANRANAASYVANVGALDTTYAATTCPTTPMATHDLCEWSNALQGTATQSTAGAVGSMIGARGCISYDAPSATATVSVAWQGLGDTAAPPASLTCGQNQYGNEAKRRVVSVPVTFGCLGC